MDMVAMAAPQEADGFQESQLFGYHLYTLGRDFKVQIPADGTAAMRYTVRYRW